MSNPPNIASDPQGWFRYFDRDGSGQLDAREVAEGLTLSFPSLSLTDSRNLVDALWPLFDHDGSGSISLHEFMQPNGLADTILAQVPSGLAPQQAQQTSNVPIPSAPPTVFVTATATATATAIPAQQSQPTVQGYAVTAPYYQGAPPPRPHPHSHSHPPPHHMHPPPFQHHPPPPPYYIPPHAPRPFQHPPAHAPPRPPGGPFPPRGFPSPAVTAVPYQTPSQMPPPTVSGRRKALLVGINYFGTSCELRGCINDTRNLQRLLIDVYGWSADRFVVLTDDNPDPSRRPTRANIISALRWLASDARRGDVLFFSFSGHGSQQPDPTGMEEDGMNEVLLPVDSRTAGFIVDDELASILVHPLPEGVRLTCIFDSCHSGSCMDLSYEWKPRMRSWREQTNPYQVACDVQLFSGCTDDGTSCDVKNGLSPAGGALTTAFCASLRANPCPTYIQLIDALQRHMRQNGYSQVPQLSSSQQFAIDRPFLFDDIVPNSNRTLGRIVRRRFPPGQPLNNTRLQGLFGSDTLGTVAAVGAGLLLADILFSS